jgi:cytoskeletal protein CcmA (bactofilin family)
MFVPPAHSALPTSLPTPQLGLPKSIQDARGPAASATSAAPAVTSGGALKSVIGRELVVLGDNVVIVTKGTLQIDGEISGNVHGAHIIIGETGKVTGTICAEFVDVHGIVHGTIRSAKVQLNHAATVEGDIHHQTLVMKEGANFDGRVRRPQDPADLAPKLDAAGHTKTPLAAVSSTTKVAAFPA